MNKKHVKVLRLMERYKTHQTVISHCNYDAEMIEIANKIAERRFRKQTKTVKEWIDSRIEAKLLRIAKGLPLPHYSMGGTVTVTFNRFRVIDCRKQQYLGKWRGNETYGYFTLKLTKEDYLRFENIGGVSTYTYPGKGKAKKAYWYVADGKNAPKKVEGWICGKYHSSISKADAIEGFKRVQEYRKLNRIKAEKHDKEVMKTLSKAMRARYSYADSLAINCEAGTNAFIMRCGLDKGKKYRGDYLLKIAKEKSPASTQFVMRMIQKKAISRL